MPNPLVGTWRLASFELSSADGKVHHPFGEDVAGHIIYGEDGYMSVTMSAARWMRRWANSPSVVFDLWG